MQTVLEQGSIDKPLTFDVGLIQLSFIPVCSLNTFQSNCAEGLHFSAFHYQGGEIYICIETFVHKISILFELYGHVLLL